MNLWRDQRGVVGIQVALILVILLGFGAFAIDYGVLLVARAQAQAAADAGALAAATTLAFDNMIDSTPAEKSARAFASEMLVWGKPPIVEVEVCSDPSPDNCPTITILDFLPTQRASFSATVSVYRDAGNLPPKPGEDPNDPKTPPVPNGSIALPTYLAGLFGVTTQGTRAQATATVAPVNIATCVWPLAMPDNWRPNPDGVPLPAGTCPDDKDEHCQFIEYSYASGAPVVVDNPDTYLPPVTDSEDDRPTGYQLAEKEDPMKPSGLDLQVFERLLGEDLPDNPTVWRPVHRRSLVAVRIGGSSFSESLTGCNPKRLHFGDYLPIDSTVTDWSAVTSASDGARKLIGDDGDATWNTKAFRMKGSCATTASCAASRQLGLSPRLVLLPVFDPHEYDKSRKMGGEKCDGLPCIKIVNYVGFFLDESTDDGHIAGHLTIYPGRAIETDTTKASFVGYKWAFMRTAILTR